MTNRQRRMVRDRNAVIGRWVLVLAQAGALALACYGALCLMLVV